MLLEIYTMLSASHRFATVICRVAAAAASGLCATVHAGDIDTLQALGQNEFHLFTQDLGAALSYQSLAPASTLGVTGFDLGFAVTGTSLDHQDLYEKASGGSSVPGTLPVPTLRVAKGLPFNIDVGAFYLAVPSSNVKLYGGEVRWAFVEGNAILPALALHGVYSKLTGVDQLDLHNQSVDLSISKGFALFTPYAGIGKVWTRATPVNVPGLGKESIAQNKTFLGVNMNFGLPNLAVEVDKTGGITSYGAKLGFRW